MFNDDSSDEELKFDDDVFDSDMNYDNDGNDEDEDDDDDESIYFYCRFYNYLVFLIQKVKIPDMIANKLDVESDSDDDSQELAKKIREKLMKRKYKQSLFLMNEV
jgi:hypothetical protein